MEYLFFFPTNYQRFLVLGLLLSSPAYFWEIAVKSDLMSNIILVLTFLLFAIGLQKKQVDNF